MKLGNLRTWVTNEEKSFSFHKLFFGFSKELSNLRIFLQKYSYLEDSYEFNAVDIYRLCKIMSPQSRFYIFVNIQHTCDPFLNNKNFLEVFHFLDQASLLNEKNFPMMYKGNTGTILYELYCDPSKKFLLPDAEHFDTLLDFVSSQYWNNQSTFNTLHLLHQEVGLTTNILNSLTGKRDYENYLRVLSDSKCLNETNMMLLLNHNKSYFGFETLFETLHQNQVRINDDFVALLAKRDIVFDLEKAINLFIKKNKLDLKTLLLLAKTDYINDNKLSLIDIFFNAFLLNDKTLTHICSEPYISEFANTVNKLVEYKILAGNHQLIDNIIDGTISNSELVKYIDHLQKLNVIDQSLIDLYLKNYESSWRVWLEYSLQLLETVKTPVYVDQIQSLFTLSFLNLKRFYVILDKLIRNNLLTPKSFKEACNIVSNKLPTPKVFTIDEKESVIKTSERNELHFNNQLYLFMDPYKNDFEINPYKGGMGEVTKGYSAKDAKVPQFCIKKLDKLDTRLAKNETKYHALSGRNSFYFVQNNNIHIVYNWLQQKALSEFSETELLSIPFAKRLQCLISGLDAIGGLHLKLRIHHDIKAGNFILNPKTSSMELIDFGAAHKKDAKLPAGWWEFPYTTQYKDPHTKHDHFCKDVYSAGFVVQTLFPEIYPCTSQRTTELNTLEKAIVRLVDNMMDNNPKNRCTIIDAKEYCQTLLANIKQINDVMLTKLTEDLSNHSIRNVEDCVLRF